MGYKFQFITLAGFHALNYGMFDLAYGSARNNMSAFVELQEKEFAAAERGFTAVKHQREVGTGYFDAVTTTIERDASTAALKGSTEDEQFFEAKHGCRWVVVVSRLDDAAHQSHKWWKLQSCAFLTLHHTED
jgi:isocitrate lyase